VGDALPCGTFEIDEIEFTGPPDTVNIKALAAGIKGKLRTKNSQAYENQTLKQIAQTIAGKNNLSVVGEIANVQIERATQNRETDLGFLRRISHEYGYVFSVRDSKLIFTTIFKLEAGTSVITIDKTDLIQWSLKDKTSATFKKAKVSYHNPKENKTESYETSDNLNADGKPITDVTKGDTLEIRTKAENKQQAKLKAKAALYRANNHQVSGSLDLEGYTILVAGQNFELTGMGALSGKYHIVTSKHTVERNGGYLMTLDIKRVGYVEKVKEAPKPRKKKPVKYRVVQ
jgi:phage protein D